jgi:hypothetical protein
LRLGRYFGTSAAFWMNLQQIYDLRRAEQALGDSLSRIRSRAAGGAAKTGRQGDMVQSLEGEPGLDGRAGRGLTAGLTVGTKGPR